METIKIDEKVFQAYTIPTPNVSIMVIRANNGMLACGYISAEASEKFGDALAIVRGVKNYDDILNAVVAYVSPEARKMGVSETMTGAEALKLMA